MSSIMDNAASLVSACQNALPDPSKKCPEKHYIRIDRMGYVLINNKMSLQSDQMGRDKNEKIRKASLSQIANLVAKEIVTPPATSLAGSISVSKFLDRLITRIENKKSKSKLSCIRNLFYAILGCIKIKSPEQRLHELNQALKRKIEQRELTFSAHT